MAFAQSSARALVAALVASGAAVAYAADPPPARPAAQVAQLVRRVAQVVADESRGVIGYRSHAVVRTSPHFIRPDQVEDEWLVNVDGRAVRGRGGDAPGPAATAAAVHHPYEARFEDEYRYADAPCTGCGPGSVAVAFDSDIHDAVHGRGVFVVDERTARLLSLTWAPFAVPRPATAATVTTTWGQTPAGWFPVAVDGTFTARIGPFSAHATLTQQITGYKRYPDVATAERDAEAK